MCWNCYSALCHGSRSRQTKWKWKNTIGRRRPIRQQEQQQEQQPQQWTYLLFYRPIVFVQNEFVAFNKGENSLKMKTR